MGAMLANQAMNYLASGVDRRGAWATPIPNIAPYQTFPVADGWVIVAVGNDGQFGRLCATLGLEALAADQRFATNAARVANRVELERELSGEDARLASATTSRRARERRSFPPGRSIRSPISSLIRSSWRAACRSSRRARPASAAPSS